MRPKLAGCRVRGQKPGAPVQLLPDHSLRLCHWPTEHFHAGSSWCFLCRCQVSETVSSDRPDPPLETSIFGLELFLALGFVVGLGCQLDGVLGLPFIWKSLQHPLPQEADRVLDSEPSY